MVDLPAGLALVWQVLEAAKETLYFCEANGTTTFKRENCMESSKGAPSGRNAKVVVAFKIREKLALRVLEINLFYFYTNRSLQDIFRLAFPSSINFTFNGTKFYNIRPLPTKT